MDAAKGTVAQQLSEHLLGFNYHTLPANVIAKAKEAVLDQVGCQLIGSTMDWCRIVREFIAGFAGRPEATVVNQSMKTGAADAAFANATCGHGCELDDHIDSGGGHPGAIAVSVALALAEREKANGKAVIDALVSGYEVTFRVGRATRGMHNKGFHSQNTVGVFASTAVAAKLLKLDASQMAQAFAIAGSHASGTMEYDQSGGSVKRVHSGLAARGGIHSAMLAKAGLTGPLTIFEGKRGILPLFAGQNDPSAILEDLGGDFGVMHVVFKPYPANISHQAPIGLLADLVEAHDIKATDVERIDLGVKETTLLHGGAIYEPQDALGAQFSLAFSLAIRVIKRSNDLRLYTDPTVWRDREVLQLAKKVHLHADPRFVGTKGRGCHLKVSLTDGRVFEVEQEYHKGMPQNPLTAAELTNKFRTTASSVLSEKRCEALMNAVSRLDALEDMGELTSLLVPE